MTATIELPYPPHETPEDFSRADLEFRGVDHAGPSYEGRLYLNNRDANPDSGHDPDAGYAGSFFVFGHGGCAGEAGHCDPAQQNRGPYDLRLPHALRPQFKTVVVTEPLRRLMRAADAEIFTLTIVAIVDESAPAPFEDYGDPLKLEGVRLRTREDAVASGLPLEHQP
jgi:tyrosinase